MSDGFIVFPSVCDSFSIVFSHMRKLLNQKNTKLELLQSSNLSIFQKLCFCTTQLMRNESQRH